MLVLQTTPSSAVDSGQELMLLYTSMGILASSLPVTGGRARRRGVSVPHFNQYINWSYGKVKKIILSQNLKIMCETRIIN